jgi:hypothetical protein
VRRNREFGFREKFRGDVLLAFRFSMCERRLNHGRRQGLAQFGEERLAALPGYGRVRRPVDVSAEPGMKENL